MPTKLSVNNRGDMEEITYKKDKFENNIFESQKVINLENDIYHFFKENANKVKIHFSNIDSKDNIEKTIYFNLNNIKDLTINGNGSKFIFHGDMASFLVNNCQNIIFKNLIIDHFVPTTVEMYVEKIEDKSVYYKIPDTFNYEIVGNDMFWMSEKDRNEKYYWKEKNSFNAHSITVFDLKEKYSKRYVLEDGPFSNIEKIEKTNSGVKIQYKSLPNAIRENIMIALNASNNRDTAGFAIVESQNIVFENVEFNYLHGFGLLVQMSENISFSNCKFIGNERHMVTSFADSIHVSGAKGKISIENCEFDSSLDDSINIHGTYTQVEEIKEKIAILRFVHHQQAGFKNYFIGDEIEFFDRKNLRRREDKKYRIKSILYPGEYNEDLQYMKVEFEENLPAYLGEKIEGQGRFVAENISYTPSVDIKNSTFSNIPSRAILCTTRKNVLIENNKFHNITMASIYVSNDANEWYESGFVDNMTIKNNLFSYSKIFLDNIMTKSIWIDPIISEEIGDFVHNKIEIIDNKFDIENKKAIVFKNTKNLIESDNIFRKKGEIGFTKNN